jgi:hypothetical protein
VKPTTCPNCGGDIEAPAHNGPACHRELTTLDACWYPECENILGDHEADGSEFCHEHLAAQKLFDAARDWQEGKGR